MNFLIPKNGVKLGAGLLCLLLALLLTGCGLLRIGNKSDVSDTASPNEQLTAEMPAPKVPDAEILNTHFWGLGKEVPDGPISWHVSVQMNDAYLGYVNCERMREDIGYLYRSGRFAKHDPQAAHLTTIITIMAGEVLAILVDTRLNENAKIDSLTGGGLKDIQGELDPSKNDQQSLLAKVDFYEDFFRQVLRIYAAYSKKELWFGLHSGDVGTRYFIDIYYPYTKQPVKISLNPEDREDAYDLLNPIALGDHDEIDNKLVSAAVEKGVQRHPFDGPIFAPKAVEPKLSRRELIALRNSCYNMDAFNLSGLSYDEAVLSLGIYIPNKLEAALPLAPPSSPSEVKEAVSWWLYWRLTPQERQAWKKYRRNVNKAAQQIDEILHQRDTQSRTPPATYTRK